MLVPVGEIMREEFFNLLLIFPIPINNGTKMYLIEWYFSFFSSKKGWGERWMWVDTFFFALIFERCIHLDRIRVWLAQVNMADCCVIWWEILVSFDDFDIGIMREKLWFYEVTIKLWCDEEEPNCSMNIRDFKGKIYFVLLMLVNAKNIDRLNRVMDDIENLFRDKNTLLIISINSNFKDLIRSLCTWKVSVGHTKDVWLYSRRYYRASPDFVFFDWGDFGSHVAGTHGVRSWWLGWIFQ